MFLTEVGGHLRQDILAGSRAARNGNFTDDLLLQRIHHLLNRIRFAQQFGRLRHEQPARVGQLETGTSAHKQLDAEVLFERFDMVADRRLREMQLLGRIRETQAFGGI